eukprot:GEMP01050015.1.p1 GENE.GEMP01050015.1~~GEMP01050015.1.p1  ORF type:complete len:133 (+),score=19.30 GEMP01050015.1:51-449(+)
MTDPTLDHIQRTVDETAVEMQSNMQLLHNREESLKSLDNKSTHLHGTSQQFTQEASRVKQDAEWESFRNFALCTYFIFEILLFFFFRDDFWSITLVASCIVAASFAAYALYARFHHLKNLGMESPLTVPLTL